MSVPSLRELLRGALCELVVQEGSPCLATDIAASQIIMGLDQGAWGSESKVVLDKVVRCFPHRLTPRIIKALLPASTTELSLRECPLITEVCLNELIERCPHLQSLDLAGNADLDFRKISLFTEEGGTSHKRLTHVSLEDCGVSDQEVHALLRNAPLLQSLNIARSNISDNAFLLSEAKQLAKEGGIQRPSLSAGYSCQLQSVDVTGCSEFTSTGVRHLCTLCGPSLKVLSMSWTKVDSTALMYLCGLGLPAVVHFYLSLEEGWPEQRQGRGDTAASGRRAVLMETLAQFEQIIAQYEEEAEHCKSGETNRNCEETSDLKSSSSSLNTHKENKEAVPKSAFTEVPVLIPETATVFCEAPHTNSSSLSPDHASISLVTSHTPPSCQMEQDTNVEHLIANGVDVTASDPSFSPLLQDVCSEKDGLLESCATTLDKESKASHSGDEFSCSNLQMQTLRDEVQSNRCLDSSENVDEASSDSKPTNDDHASPPTHEIDLHTIKSSPSKTMPYFTPNITELCISGTVFSDAPASLQCLRRFLVSNPGLRTLGLMGGLNGHSVTDEVLAEVTEKHAPLKRLSVEGCVHLTTAAVAGLKFCQNLEHLDLTGVAFVENAGLVLLAKSLSLTGLLLAETRVMNTGLTTIAYQPGSQKLQELDLSWCEDLEDDQGLNAVVSSCSGLCRLMLRECALSLTTLELISANCRSLTELSIACNLSVVNDDGVIMLSQNLALLEIIDLSWNSYLTDESVHALLTNCRCLKVANLSGLKRITAAPFCKIIAVPEELSQFIKVKQREREIKEVNLKLCDLPCLPHRSTLYATRLSSLQLQYSDYVQDQVLNDIVAITLGSITIMDYYGSELTIVEGAVERFVMDLFHCRGDDMGLYQ